MSDIVLEVLSVNGLSVALTFVILNAGLKLFKVWLASLWQNGFELNRPEILS